jgi:nitroreductase
MEIPHSDARIFDAMYQCRAMRRLKPDPVPEDVLVALVDAALQGPSGRNAQNWTFVIVRDGEQKRRVQAVWQRAWRLSVVGINGRSCKFLIGRPVRRLRIASGALSGRHMRLRSG